MRSYETVLVTGASRGLGAALGRELAMRGYRVLLAARSEADLVALIESLPPEARARAGYLAVDLRRLEGLASFAAQAQARLGSVDVLINNAGIGSYKPFAEWSPAELIDCMHVNLMAPMLLSHALLPAMRGRGRGMLLQIASDLARRYLANMAPYVASKFGLLGLSGSLLREVKGQGIKVTTVLPGIIDSAFGGGREGEKGETWSLRPAQLAARVVDLLELPEHVVIDELAIHPMQQDF